MAKTIERRDLVFWVPDGARYTVRKTTLPLMFGGGKGLVIVRSESDDDRQQALVEIALDGPQAKFRQIDGDLDFGPVALRDGVACRSEDKPTVYQRLWNLVLA